MIEGYTCTGISEQDTCGHVHRTFQQAERCRQRHQQRRPFRCVRVIEDGQQRLLTRSESLDMMESKR